MEDRYVKTFDLPDNWKSLSAEEQDEKLTELGKTFLEDAFAEEGLSVTVQRRVYH